MLDEVLTIKEVAALLKLAEKTVYAMAQAGESPALRSARVAEFRGYEGDVSFASYLVHLRVSEKVDSEFLNYSLNSPYMLARARAEALPAIGQANLNPNRYSYIVVAIPP